MKKFYLIFNQEVNKEDYITKVSNVVNNCLHRKMVMYVEATTAQVKALKQDSNVLDMFPEELAPVEQEQGVKNVDYKRTSFAQEKIDTHYGNWGLIRHSSLTDVGSSDNLTTETYNYNYDGSGVDIILNLASVLDLNDPEFKTSGTSRINQFQWKTLDGFSGLPTIDYNKTGVDDIDDHAESVAYCAVSNTYGWATGADLYIWPRDQMDAGSAYIWNTGWDAMKKFHQSKGNDRPTLVIDSIGYGSYNFFGSYATKMLYRGEIYDTVAPAGGPDVKIKHCLQQSSGKNYGMPSRQRTSEGGTISITEGLAWTDKALLKTQIEDKTKNTVWRLYGEPIEEMVAAGVHHVSAAGNYSDSIHLKGHPDYANAYRWDYWYRSDENDPWEWKEYTKLTGQANQILAGDTIAVAALGMESKSEGINNKEILAQFSTRGSRIDAVAAGENIRLDLYTHGTYVANGTSFASPNVGGMAALVLGKYPTTTPKQLRRYFREQAVGTDTVYDSNLGLADSSKYGDPAWYGQAGTFGYSNKIAYLDPSLSFNPTTLPDTSIEDSTVTTQDNTLDYTIDQINTKLGSI